MQLQHFAGWGVQNMIDPNQALLLSQYAKYHLLAQLEEGGSRDSSRYPTLKLMNKVRKEIKQIMG